MRSRSRPNGERAVRLTASKTIAALALVAFVAVGCSSKSTPPPSTGGNSVSLHAKDFSFTPQQLHAKTSQSIVITNDSQTLHNFSIQGTPISQDIPPGQTITLAAPGPSFAPGTYPFFCKYHKSRGMTGTLVATAG